MKKIGFTLIKILIFSVSLFFLIFTIYSNIDKLKEINIASTGVVIVYVILSSIMYAVLLLFLALGWKKILESLSKITISYKLVLIYLRSLIFKYIPGNVFHYVARQVEAKKEGASHKVLIHSNIIESVVLIVASLAISSLALIFMQDTSLDNYIHHVDMNLIYGVGIGSILAIILIGRYNKIGISDYVQPFFLYMIFFLCIGFITYIIVIEVLQLNISLPICIFLYSLSWLAGFITPGAPGGLGVRESLFIVLSNGILSESDALVLSVLLRIITILGEILVFMIASVIINRQNKQIGIYGKCEAIRKN